MKRISINANEVEKNGGNTERMRQIKYNIESDPNIVDDNTINIHGLNAPVKESQTRFKNKPQLYAI